MGRFHVRVRSWGEKHGQFRASTRTSEAHCCDDAAAASSLALPPPDSSLPCHVAGAADGSLEVYRTLKVNRAGLRKSRLLIIDDPAGVIRQLKPDGSVKFETPVASVASVERTAGSHGVVLGCIDGARLCRRQYEFATGLERESFVFALSSSMRRLGLAAPAARASPVTRVLVATWNMGGAPPPRGALGKWLGDTDAALVAVGVQEAPGGGDLRAQLQDCLGAPAAPGGGSSSSAGYLSVASVSLVAMRLHVFVRADLAHELSAVDTGYRA